MPKGKRKSKRSANVKVVRLSLDEEARKKLSMWSQAFGVPMQDVAGACVNLAGSLDDDLDARLNLEAQRLHKRRLTYRPPLLD